MDGWFGLRATGRQFREPTATLHELEDAQGLRYTAIAFDEPYRGHPLLTTGVALVRSFLEYPMVVGLVELAHADLERAVFAYPTGSVWSLKEVLRVHADLVRPIGLRAALELAYLAGQTLLEAAENGSGQGCFSHGGITPWRLALRADGQVQVLGHGLPQVDVIAHRIDEKWVVDADSLRYAPPERLTGVPEDVAADLLALTLIAYEMITAQPLYAGHDAAEVAHRVSMSEGVAVLSRPNDLPRPVAQVFARALVYDPDARLSGQAWIDEIGNLLDHHHEGDSLEVVADRLRGTRREGPRRAAKLVASASDTAGYTPDQLRDVVPDATPARGPETRWSRPTRERRAAAANATEVTPAGVPRRRRRRGEPAEAASQADAPPQPAATERRRRTASAPAEDEADLHIPDLKLDQDEDPDDVLLEAPSTPVEAAETPRPRVKRRAEAEGTGDVPTPRRRRRRDQ